MHGPCFHSSLSFPEIIFSVAFLFSVSLFSKFLPFKFPSFCLLMVYVAVLFLYSWNGSWAWIPLSTLLHLYPTIFEIMYSNFHSVHCGLKFLLRLFGLMGYLEVCFISKCLEIFLLSLRCCFLVWFHCGQRKHFIWFKFFSIFWG